MHCPSLCFYICFSPEVAKAATKAGVAEHLLYCLHNVQTVVEKLKNKIKLKIMYSTRFCLRTN